MLARRRHPKSVEELGKVLQYCRRRHPFCQLGPLLVRQALLLLYHEAPRRAHDRRGGEYVLYANELELREVLVEVYVVVHRHAVRVGHVRGAPPLERVLVLLERDAVRRRMERDERQDRARENPLGPLLLLDGLVELPHPRPGRHVGWAHDHREREGALESTSEFERKEKLAVGEVHAVERAQRLALAVQVLHVERVGRYVSRLDEEAVVWVTCVEHAAARPRPAVLSSYLERPARVARAPRLVVLAVRRDLVDARQVVAHVLQVPVEFVELARVLDDLADGPRGPAVVKDRVRGILRHPLVSFLFWSLRRGRDVGGRIGRRRRVTYGAGG